MFTSNKVVLLICTRFRQTLVHGLLNQETLAGHELEVMPWRLPWGLFSLLLVASGLCGTSVGITWGV